MLTIFMIISMVLVAIPTAIIVMDAIIELIRIIYKEKKISIMSVIFMIISIVLVAIPTAIIELIRIIYKEQKQ